MFFWDSRITHLIHEIGASAIEGCVVVGNETLPEGSIEHLAHLVEDEELPLSLRQHVTQELHVCAARTGVFTLAAYRIEDP